MAFAAEHRIVLASQLQALLSISDSALHARLRALGRAGLLTHEALFEREPPCYWITRRALGAIASPLPPPRRDPRSYRHDIGLVWVWLAARGGAFGPVGQIVAEREMRSSDASAAHTGLLAGSEPNNDGGSAQPQAQPFAVRLGGVGPGGRQRLHYPDLLLIGGDRRRIALELELTPKARVRRERILAGYAAESRIEHVVYLVNNASIARAVEGTAARLGISGRVHVRRVRFGEQRTTELTARATDRADRSALRSPDHRDPGRAPELGR